MLTVTDLEFAEVHVPPVLVVEITSHCAPDPASISAATRQAFGSLMSFVTRHGLAINGQPRTIYTGVDAGGMSFICALPVASGPATLDDPSIRLDTLEEANAYRFTHHGPYPDLGKTYNQITAFMKEKGLMKSEADWARYMPMWEQYVNNPETTPASELVTHIYLPAV